MTMRPLVLVLAIAAHDIHAQSLDTRVAAARGSVSFAFDTKHNVCGNGASIMISNDTSAGWTTRSRRSGIVMGRGSSGDTSRCEEGPAHVLLTRAGGTITDVSVTVGGRDARGNTDLGAIGAAEASRYLLELAPRIASRGADQAVMGAAIADAPLPWRRMLAIARAGDASESSRKASLFWVSQEASAVATAGLSEVAMDDTGGAAVQSAALFYLSQRRNGDGVPSLIKVVRESKSMKLKQDAIFYLSKSRDPRALDLFEKLLAGR